MNLAAEHIAARERAQIVTVREVWDMGHLKGDQARSEALSRVVDAYLTLAEMMLDGHGADAREWLGDW